MTGLLLRPLNAKERAAVFTRTSASYDRVLYLDTVREMEGGVAYAIALNGVSARAVKMRLSKAASTLGVKLRHAGGKAGKEIYVELADG